MPRSFQFLKPQAVRNAVENQVFGRAINEEEYGDLIGDITGNTNGTIDFNVFSADLNKSVAILIRSQNATFNTTVRLDPNEFHYRHPCRRNPASQTQTPAIKSSMTIRPPRLFFETSP